MSFEANLTFFSYFRRSSALSSAVNQLEIAEESRCSSNGSAIASGLKTPQKGQEEKGEMDEVVLKKQI